MVVVKNIQNRYIYFTLNFTNNCSWWLNVLTLKYSSNLLYVFLLQCSVLTFVLQKHIET
jgi:hypothetical protein